MRVADARGQVRDDPCGLVFAAWPPARISTTSTSWSCRSPWTGARVPRDGRAVDASADLPRVRRGRLLRRLARPPRLVARRVEGHPIMRSIEPGEDWAWCFPDELAMRIPAWRAPRGSRRRRWGERRGGRRRPARRVDRARPAGRGAGRPGAARLPRAGSADEARWFRFFTRRDQPRARGARLRRAARTGARSLVVTGGRPSGSWGTRCTCGPARTRPRSPSRSTATWEGRGLATTLLAHLAEAAARRGHRRVRRGHHARQPPHDRRLPRLGLPGRGHDAARRAARAVPDVAHGGGAAALRRDRERDRGRRGGRARPAAGVGGGGRRPRRRRGRVGRGGAGQPRRAAGSRARSTPCSRRARGGGRRGGRRTAIADVRRAGRPGRRSRVPGARRSLGLRARAVRGGCARCVVRRRARSSSCSRARGRGRARGPARRLPRERDAARRPATASA